MNKYPKEKIDQILAQSFYELDQMAKLDSELDGSFNTGTWTNNRNLMVGYLSYYPGSDPAEQSIDVTIKLTFSENIIEFVADVCWSDGQDVKEIVEHNISFTSQQEFLLELSKLCEMVNQNALQYLKSLLH